MKRTIAILAVISLSACANLDGTAYWMKAYPNASADKTQKCLALANAAYEKAYTGAPMGQNGWGVLAKGEAWEKCQDGK